MRHTYNCIKIMFTITATCDPYNAKHHYHGEEVIRYQGATPIEWVIDKYSSIEEAQSALWSMALEECDNNLASLSHIFDENIEADIQAISEDEELDEAGIRELRNWFASWYKGEGVYYNDSRDVMMLKGDECYSFDTMSYSIKSF